MIKNFLLLPSITFYALLAILPLRTVFFPAAYGHDHPDSPSSLPTLFKNNRLNPALHENAGLIEAGKGNWENAITQFEKAAETTPLSQTSSYITWAMAYYHTRQDVLALEKFDIALQKDPLLSPIVYFAAAEPAMNLEQWEKAAGLFDRGFSRLPFPSYQPSAVNYSNAGLAHLECKHWHQAHTYLSKALELDPNLHVKVHQRKATAEKNIRS